MLTMEQTIGGHCPSSDALSFLKTAFRNSGLSGILPPPPFSGNIEFRLLRSDIEFIGNTPSLRASSCACGFESGPGVFRSKKQTRTGDSLRSSHCNGLSLYADNPHIPLNIVSIVVAICPEESYFLPVAFLPQHPCLNLKRFQDRSQRLEHIHGHHQDFDHTNTAVPFHGWIGRAAHCSFRP
jgi:hypothetical protein